MKFMTGSSITHRRSTAACAHWRNQRGMSLVELMVVIAIVGALASTAAVSMRTDPDVEDVAHAVAAMINEASRMAISGGPVDPDATRRHGQTARSRMQILDDGIGGQRVAVQYYDEVLGDFTLERKSSGIPRTVTVVGWTNRAELDPGTTPVVPTATFAPFTMCAPDGTCNALTVYLQDVNQPDRRARVVVLPLNGMNTQVFSGW